MNLYELAARVIEALEAEKIPYRVVGALSSSVFGIPRATKDVDIVLQLQTREPLRCLEERLSQVVIVQKLRWGRAKDLEDARDVLAVQTPAKLDMSYITRWCEVHQTSLQLNKMLSEVERLD